VKEAQVQSYLPDDANVPTSEGNWCHLASTIEPSICGGDAVEAGFGCKPAHAITGQLADTLTSGLDNYWRGQVADATGDFAA